MNPCELTTGVTAIANVIARNVSDEELDVLAAVFTQLGDTLATISVLRDSCKKNEDETKDEKELKE